MLEIWEVSNLPPIAIFSFEFFNSIQSGGRYGVVATIAYLIRSVLEPTVVLQSRIRYGLFKTNDGFLQEGLKFSNAYDQR